MAKKKVLKTTVVSFLLDETGSMTSIKDDTIGGFNTYLDSLKDPTYGPVDFTLVKFDSNKIEKVYVGVPVNKVVPLTSETYIPGASTPLIDAAYKIIKATEQVITERKDKPQILVVIQTDGQENASTEFTMQELNQLIKEKTAEGWQFVFLGAGIDAFSQAQQWGIAGQNALSYARGKSESTFQSLVGNTTRYRGGYGGQSLGFSDAQRIASGDTYFQDDKQDPDDKQSVVTPPDPVVNAPRTRKSIVDDFSLVKK